MITIFRHFILVLLLILFYSCQEPVSLITDKSNQNAVITSLIADPDTVQVGGISILTCQANDPGGGPLTYQWSAELGDINGSGYQVRYSASPCCTGTVRITVTVRVNTGGTTQQNFYIVVID